MIPSSHENVQRHYWPHDATCDRCGAKEGRSGAHDRAGTWHSLLSIMGRFGFAFEKDEVYDRHFGEATEPEPTVLLDGRCQFCRRDGQA